MLAREYTNADPSCMQIFVRNETWIIFNIKFSFTTERIEERLRLKLAWGLLEK